MTLLVLWYVVGLLLSLVLVRASFGEWKLSMILFSLMFGLFGPLVAPILLIESKDAISSFISKLTTQKS